MPATIDEIRFSNSDTPVLSLEADHDARRLLGEWWPTMLGALFAVIVAAGILRFITNTAWWWETRRDKPPVRRPGQRRNH
jgi:hypothetical protein